MAFLGFREALQTLSRMNETLEAEVARRTRDLEETVRALEKVDAERGELMGRLVNAQEEERRRIAADIHDDSVQVMSALQIRLSLLRPLVEGSEEAADFDEVASAVRRCIGRLRHLMFELRPPALDHLGLVAAIELEAAALSRRTGLRCRVIAKPVKLPLTAAQNTAVFRIVQEALTNVVRHAKASAVQISLQNGRQSVRVQIKDNGRGITRRELANPAAIGLLGMRERAAF